MRYRAPLLALLALAVVPVAVSAISSIRAINLDDGYDDINRITAPVVDPATAPRVEFSVTGAFDRSAKIVRRGANGLFTRGPEYNLDKAVDLAGHLSQALKSEAAAMGFRTGPGEDLWRVAATIRTIFLESRQVPYGATLFYGYLVADVQARLGGGAPVSSTLRIHDYVGKYNAGMGRRDEAEAALAHLLVEGAQDLISRLNRELFKAAAHPDIDRLAGVATGPKVDKAAVHRLGLSGAPAVTAAFVAALTREPDENRRSELINALADLGDPAAVAPLSSRYGTEDEDCRWYTLKAMDYIGGETAMALVRDQGLKDEDGGPRRLAERITGTAK